MRGGQFRGEAGSQFLVGDLHHVVALGGGRANYRVAHHSHVPAIAAVAVQLGGQLGVVLACPRPGRSASRRSRWSRRGGQRTRLLLLFRPRGAGGAGQQHHTVLLAGGFLDAAGDGGEVGIGDVVDNQADQS